MNQEEANQKFLEIMNKKDNLLSEEEIKLFKELMFQCDLKIQNKDGWTILMYAFMYNKEQNLNLNQNQFEYLIKNSALIQQDKYGDTPLMYALFYNKKENLQLTIKQFKIMYRAINEEEKQTTFKNIIEANYNNDYLEEINLFLYDLQFKPHEETIYWLKENQHQDILEKIEKRNLFFQLNQEFKEIDKKEKIAKIKL